MPGENQYAIIRRQEFQRNALIVILFANVLGLIAFLVVARSCNGTSDDASQDYSGDASETWKDAVDNMEFSDDDLKAFSIARTHEAINNVLYNLMCAEYQSGGITPQEAEHAINEVETMQFAAYEDITVRNEQGTYYISTSVTDPDTRQTFAFDAELIYLGGDPTVFENWEFTKLDMQ